MELNAIDQMKRTAVRGRERKTDAPETAGAASAGTQPKKDSIDLAERAVAALKEQNQRLMNLLQQQEREMEKPPALWEMAEAGGKSESDMLDALGENMKVVDRCHKIAVRIMRGDKVPPQDEQYLMKNDPEGFKLAMAMRRPKRKPKKWESVLKDEEKKASENDIEEEPQEASQASEAASESGGDAAADSGGE